MTDRSLSLQIDGLREATSAMRKVKGETVKEVSQYHKQVAEFVAQDARSKAQSRPRKIHSGHTAAAIRTRGTQREAAIRVVAPDAYVQEFGGRAPLFGNRNKWFTVRPKRKGGYFLFPAVKDNRDRINRFYLKGLESAIARYWAK